jgi:hypothetical protein
MGEGGGGGRRGGEGGGGVKPSELSGYQTTEFCRRRGSRARRGQGWFHEVVVQGWELQRSQGRMPSVSGGGSELGGSLPLAAYQAAPLLALPLRWGMAVASVDLGWKKQRTSGP